MLTEMLLVVVQVAEVVMLLQQREVLTEMMEALHPPVGHMEPLEVVALVEPENPTRTLAVTVALEAPVLLMYILMEQRIIMLPAVEVVLEPAETLAVVVVLVQEVMVDQRQEVRPILAFKIQVVEEEVPQCPGLLLVVALMES